MADQDQDEVLLELDAPYVSLAVLVSAAGTLANLVGEVSRSVLKGESVEWTVEVRTGSVVLPVKPQAATDVRARLVRAVSEGMALVEAQPERPPHFTDRALVQARALANLSTDDHPIRVGDGHRAVRLTKALVAHVDQVTGDAPPRIGTVEGRLEAVNVHGRPTFSIWERSSGQRVECVAGESLTVEDMGAALGRRVAVRGRIRASKGGEKRRIDATELHVFPAEEELPSADEVRGILKAS
jgi:hypothetical protein